VNVPHVLKLRCHYCSREREIWRIHQLAGNAQLICDYCLDHHNQAIEFLAGRGLPGCNVCERSWQTLRDACPESVEVKLYVVPKDGVLQLLCAGCLPAYVSKRSDLYGGTAFGANALNL
jgi:hypothetical protein